MTREEQINEAVETYINGLFEDGIEIPIEDYENIGEGFVAGAKWADEHPDLSSLWHDASEEPKLGEDIIALDCDGSPVSGVYEDYVGKGIYRYHCFLCELDAIAKWAYVSDLLPKGCNE